MNNFTRMMHNLSDFIYEKTVMNVNSPSPEQYQKVFENSEGAGYGCGNTWALVFLVVVSLIAVLSFYYGVAKTATKATPKNYLITCLIGFVTLVVVNVVGLAVITKAGNDAIFCWNMFKLNAIDIVYYLVLFELWSLCFKESSNASAIDLISILKTLKK